jgi:hypothetical protein
VKRLVLLLAAASGPALAGGRSATATGAAQAEIVAPLVVKREADLDFGAIFATTAPGTVMLGADGTWSYTGGAYPACAPGACGPLHPAAFDVAGEGGRAYLVTLPSAVTATGTTPQGTAAPPLDVAGLTVRTASRPSAGPAGQLDATGHDRFQVGGTLHVPAGIPAASYRATIAVMVTYG